MFNNQNGVTAFETQEPKYVKILKFDYFLSSLRPSFHPKFRLQNSYLLCVTIWLPGQWKLVGAVYSPDIAWHLSEITESRKKKKIKKRKEGIKTQEIGILLQISNQRKRKFVQRDICNKKTSRLTFFPCDLHLPCRGIAALINP